MDGTKGRIIRHIKSARQWLEQAERDFDTESPTRGELNLILARAEVQHAQENRAVSLSFASKVAMYLCCNKKAFGIVFGVICLSATFLVSTWNISGQYANGSSIHSFSPKIKLEIPATLSLKSAASFAPSENKTAHSEPVHMEKANASAKAVTPTVEQSNMYALKSEASQETATRTEANTFVSEEELRALARTAERVLKNAK